MKLRNKERIAGSGLPNTNATVQIYVASLTDVYGSPVSFTDHNGNTGTSTVTNANGMWEAIDLPDGQYYDVKVTQANGRVKWYYGRTMHQVELMHDDKTPAHTRSILRNGMHDGWGSWVRRGGGTLTGISTTPVEVADYWYLVCTGGDSCTGTRISPVGIGAQYASEIVYTRVGGISSYKEVLPEAFARHLQNRVMSFSIAVHQSANAKLRAYIQDSTGQSNGVLEETIGSWVILSVTRTIGLGANSIECGWLTDSPAAGTYTIRTTAGALDYGATIPTPTLEPYSSGQSPSDSDRFSGLHTVVDSVALPSTNSGFPSDFVSYFGRRIRDIIGAGPNTWKDTVPRTLTQLLGDVSARVLKVGDSMSGPLIMANGINVVGRDTGGTPRNIGQVSAGNEVLLGSSANALRLLGLTLQYFDGATNQTIWHSGNNHNHLAASIIDLAAAVSGMTAAFAVSAGDASTLGGQNSAYYRARANHTGTQLAATISDLAAAVSGMSAAFATNATNATNATTAGTANAIADGAVSTTAKLADSIITLAKMAASASDAAAGTPSLRSLGTGSAQAAAGGHTHTPVANSANGSYTGNSGGDRVISSTLGFQPRLVIVSTSNSLFMSIRNNIWIGGNAGANWGLSAGGSLDGNGFTVPTGLNLSPTAYTWSAFG